MDNKTAAAIITAIFLVSMFTFITNLSLADAYANQDFNMDRASWPMFHGNLAHTGYASTGGPRTNNTLWEFSCGQPFWSAAAISNGIVYIGSQWGYLFAINFSTGENLWSHRFTGAFTSTPAVQDGVVYVGYVGEVRALDALTGEILWTFSNDNIVTYSSPAVKDGFVYVGCMDNCVYALNSTTGDKIWSYTTGSFVYSSPAVANGIVYVGSFDGYVYPCQQQLGHLFGSIRQEPSSIHRQLFQMA